MSKVNLNGRYETLAPDSEITKFAVSPWKAKVNSGGVEYSDFSQAELEEYHDFRNGIGKNRAVGSEARLQWSEGIDFTTEGQSVLGPLVTTADYADWASSTAYVLLNFRIPTTADGKVYECTTAGTSGGSEPTWDTTVGNTTSDNTATWTCRNYLAPIKIIDFQSNTYVIQNSRILKWDGTNLDGVDNSLASPLDAIVITDDTDEYLAVTSALEAIKTIDGTTWTTFVFWLSPTGFNDPDSQWTNETNAYDNNTSTSATASVGTNIWSKYLELTITEQWISKFRFYAEYNATRINSIDLDAYYNGTWNDVYEGSFSDQAWVTKTMAAPHRVSKARVRFFNTYESPENADLYEFDFGVSMGYMTEYDNRLYFLTTGGGGITYSIAKNIDSYGGTFNLTGNFGTVYDFFAGSLLADGTPTIYFSGTEGLWAIDVSSEKAYKQKISYPPLTFSGHKGLDWNANVWVATGYGIIKVSASLATLVGPDQDDGLPSGFQGFIYNMVTVNNWLVYCVNGGSTDKSSILKRNSSYGGNLQVYTTSATNKPIACMWHSPSSLYTNGRLWFGEDTSVKYMMFPDTTSNVKQVSAYEYVDDSGYGKLPIFRKLAAISKTALGVSAITKSCDADDYIEVFYGLNGADPTTSLGTFKSSPRPTILKFNSGLGIEFYTIQLSLKLFRNGGNTTSPELESLLFYYLPTPSTINGWIFDIEATSDTSEEIITRLEAVRDTNTLVLFYPTGDTSKTSYNVKLTSLPLRFYVPDQTSRKGFVTVQVEQIFEG